MIGTATRDATTAAVQRAAATADDVPALLEHASTALRRVVPHDAAAWLVTDPTTLLFSDGRVEGFGPDTCAPWFEGELGIDDLHLFRDIPGGRARVLSRVDDRSASWRWRTVMRPQGLDDELRVTCDAAGATWGAVELHRGVGDEDFAPDEVELVERVAAALGEGLRRLALVPLWGDDAGDDAPGVLRVAADGTPTPLTAAGARWVERLAPSANTTAHTALLSAARLRRNATGRRVGTRTIDGTWVTLHAQDGLGGGDAVVVVEPSRPSEVARVLMRGYGLTPREREVTLMLARGASTREIADELFVSRHTVRDHVKAAMAKLDVGSRGELVAALFARHHEPLMAAHVVVEG